ncbi:MAG: DNA polymerase/3'-5' exonuclease PolX [Burkholderiales bacterium]
MPVVNASIGAIFEEIADLLDIQGANPFRIRAYRNAARTIGGLTTDIKTIVRDAEKLKALPGIGDDLAAKIQEIVATGRCEFLERLRKQVPPAVVELLRIPGLGPKRVRVLYQDLEVQTHEQLLRAALDRRVRELPGFGEKMEGRIVEAVRAHLAESRRFKLAVAAQYAESLVGHLQKARGVHEVVVAGSFRRMRETVGDLDVLVTARASAPVMERFIGYDEVKEVLSRGDTRATVMLHCGLQVDIRVVAAESYGAALHYFTGSKAHSIAIRKLAQARGLKLNEYGVFRGARRIAGESEESVYRAVGLPWIPPELREDRGEIDAARAGRLPKLVELSDLKGDLHAHSSASDGHDSIVDMARAAKARGLSYLAITEHSRRLTVAHGLDAARLARQIDEIDVLNGKLSGITVLKGIEVDILEDGSLDLPEAILSRLDVVVAAVHSKFNLSRAKQTERILKAIDNPRVSILAHPTGRLIDDREPYDVDMSRVIRKAGAGGCHLELNAHPDRLDLLDTYCQMAKAEGVLVSVNSDSHSVHGFDNLRFGIGQARRGWLEAGDVLNTRTVKEVRRLLNRSRRRA